MTTPRRRREWQDIFVDESTTSGGLDQEGLINESFRNKGMTLVRMIIGLDIVAVSPVSGDPDNMIFSMGIGMISSEISETSTEINVGIQGDDPASGWLFRRRFLVYKDLRVHTRMDLDIRSQRKLMYGVPRLFLSNNAGSGTAFVVQTTGLIRCLYLLP